MHRFSRDLLAMELPERRSRFKTNPASKKGNAKVSYSTSDAMLLIEFGSFRHLDFPTIPFGARPVVVYRRISVKSR